MPDVQEFPIPDEVVPETRVCVQFSIPDNATYRQILVGWMNQLTYQYNWQRDEGRNAVTCSNLFKQSRAEMIASLTEGCGDNMYFKMRINPEDNCTSEAQYEPDGEWIPFMTQGCCCDTTEQVILHQVNPTTNQLEISTDGGETWTPDPESPINTVVTAWPPPVTTGISNTKCDAATNGKQHIEDLIAGTSVWLETAGTVFELAVGVCTALLALITAASGFTLAAPAAALATAIWAAGAAALEIGKAAFDAYWDSIERDKITCALYCNIGEDGAFTDAGYAAFISDWSQNAIPSPAFNVVLSSIKAGGVKGLNNLCAYGASADEDCSDCDCPDCALDYDFRVQPYTIPLTSSTGTWISGQGYKSTNIIPGEFTQYETSVEVVFSEPCLTNFFRVEWFMTGQEEYFGHANIQYLRMISGELVWQVTGISPTPDVEHDETFDASSGHTVPFYGVRVQLYNLGSPAAFYIREIELLD